MHRDIELDQLLDGNTVVATVPGWASTMRLQMQQNRAGMAVSSA
jgi:hypothetical protein